MASETVTVGSIIIATLRTFTANVPAVALYLLIFTIGGFAIDYLGTYETLEFNIAFGLALIAYILGSLVGAYLLTEAMLKRAGLFHYDGPRRFFPYIGQGILVGLGVGFGLVLLIVPGIILAMRWMLAAPLLVNGGRAVESIEQSWRLTKGYAGRIFLAGLPIGLVLVTIVIVSIAMESAGTVVAGSGEAIASLIVQNLASELLSVLSVALAVSVYGLIGFKLDDVFA